MCVAVAAWFAHPRWRLVAIGNRDEYHERPASPLERWTDGSGIIAGRDLRAGGTWLGVGEAGRFALVTNFRVPGYPKLGMASRGALVSDWLEAGSLDLTLEMNPFNLFVADETELRLITNYPAAADRILPPGVHSLSNGAFDRPWPKSRALCASLADWLDGSAENFAPLFAALADRTKFSAGSEPDDGPEPHYSPVFIADPVYGTRCSTIIAIDHTGRGTMTERRFTADAMPSGETSLAIEAAA